MVSLRGELARVQERIAELEDRLRQTSRNSSVPPSADGLAKPPPRSRSLRMESGRKPGGQDGHLGQALARVAKADREERHEPGWCSRCGPAAKHGLQFFDALVMLTEGRPWMPAAA